MDLSAPQPAHPDSPPSDCVFQTILGFLLPFFLAGAGGDPDLAGAAILELIEAYGAATVRELDLVGRVIGFSTVAMDSLRLSMSGPEMSDAKILRYRSSAVALSRMAEQCRAALDAMQAGREQARVPLGPPDAAATAAAGADPAAAARPLVRLRPPGPAAPTGGAVAAPAPDAGVPEAGMAGVGMPEAWVPEAWVPEADIALMRRDARRMIEALHAQGCAMAATADPLLPAPGPLAAAKAAARAALAAAGAPRIQAAAVTRTRC